jgi:hypothetical protein
MMTRGGGATTIAGIGGSGSPMRISNDTPARTGAVIAVAIPITATPNSALVFIRARFDGAPLRTFRNGPLKRARRPLAESMMRPPAKSLAWGEIHTHEKMACASIRQRDTHTPLLRGVCVSTTECKVMSRFPAGIHDRSNNALNSRFDFPSPQRVYYFPRPWILSSNSSTSCCT